MESYADPSIWGAGSKEYLSFILSATNKMDGQWIYTCTNILQVTQRHFAFHKFVTCYWKQFCLVYMHWSPDESPKLMRAES